MAGTALAKKIVAIFCLWLGTCILCAIAWIKKQFAQVALEEILYYAMTPLKGAHLNITGIVICDVILKSLFIALSIVFFFGSDITVQFRLNIAKLNYFADNSYSFKLKNIYNNHAMMKFILIVFLVFIVGIHAQDPATILFSAIELFLLFYFSNIVAKSNKKLSYAVNSLLCFVFLLQLAFLYYTDDYVSLIILDNINVYNALGTGIATYFISFLILLTISFLPFKFSLKMIQIKSFLGFTGAFICLSLFIYKLDDHNIYSPYLSLGRTVIKVIKTKIETSRYEKIDKDKILTQFYKNSIPSRETLIGQNLSRHPNVIVIFAEGMSAEVLDVFNDLNFNLTPNLNEFYEQALVFKNYYNHTAATFRGLRGQLFSGYQYIGGYYNDGTGFGEMKETELIKQTTTKLISIGDILNDAGYTTLFINPEPSNIQFTNYLKTLGFGEVLSGNITDRYLTDSEAFYLLTNTVFKLNDTAPFFIAMYNIGTHHGVDSPDLKYGNGNNSLLNKFHNYDAEFGLFFTRLLETGIFDNTILIFTADHATFNSPEYKYTFKSGQEYFINTIPLFIYWRGIDHKIIDAGGRNSLDLAPTILDILKIYDHENYFLGSSLFMENVNNFSKISAIGDEFYYTGGGVISVMKTGNPEIKLIKEYYSILVNSD
jgi:phosphoglycerol transferase MdoB-like AlkP superfamily enzyme